MDTESKRQKYHPERIRLLFIGESPPASGKFFYDPEKASSMTTYTIHAFEKAQLFRFSSTERFLDYFKHFGCFLDDLCHDPIDRLPEKKRKKCLENGITQLSERIAAANPPVVIIFLKKIVPYVSEAIQRSGCTPVTHVLPFPGNGHQAKYIDALSKIVRDLS